MKKNILLLCTMLLGLCSWTTEKERFVITGQLTRTSAELNALNGQKLYLTRLINGKESRIDSTRVKNGQFRFEGAAVQNEAPYLITGFENGAVLFFPDAGHIQVEPFDAQEPFRARVTGTPNNDVMAGYHDVVERCRQRSAERVKALPEHIKGDEEALRLYKEMLASNDSLYAKMEIMKYVKHHLSSPAVLYILDKELFDVFSAKVVERQLLRSLSENLHEHPLYMDLLNRMRSKSMKTGSEAPDIDGITSEGEKIRLSDLKGKYVLLHFWKSSEGGAIDSDFSVLKEIMKASEGKNSFAILSFYVGENPAEWSADIEKNQLTHSNWIHVSTLGGDHSEVIKLFNVKSLPYTVLLNPKSQIVSFDIKGEELKTKAIHIIEGVEVYE